MTLMKIGLKTRIKSVAHRSLKRAAILGEEYHAPDIAGVLVGFLVLNGTVARFLPQIVTVALLSAIGLGIVSVWLYGSNGAFKLSYYAFRATLWVNVSMALVFVTTGTEVLAISPNWAGWTIFSVFLGYFFFVVWMGNGFLKAYRKVVWTRP